MSEKGDKKILDLKPGMENVSLTVRVLEATAPRVIQTRKGPRTISEAVVGDSTGRARLTLWGNQAGSLEEGKAIHIEGAWTTSYKGQVVINVGNRSSITEVGDDKAPGEEEVPEVYPTAPMNQPRRGGRGGFRGRGRRAGSGWRGSF
ncbi:MAG: single-stranded DNA-binding protein [Pyrodictiaceae archaeon]